MTDETPIDGQPDPVETLAEFKERAKIGMEHSKEWREEAKELYEFNVGRQWDAEDEAKLKEQSRPMVTFNLMQKFLDAVTGLQINNRQEIRCFPRQMGAVKINELATGALAWNRDQCEAEYEETDAGADCLLTGMGWCETFFDDLEDKEGAVSVERRDPLMMLWDPGARKKNLSDRRWQIYLKRMDNDEYKELFGTEPTGTLDVSGLEQMDDDPAIHIIEKPQDYRGAAMSGESRSKCYAADYQWSCIKEMVDVQALFPTGPMTNTFSPEEWANIEQSMTAANVPHQVKKYKARKYYRCWINGEGVYGDIKEIPSFTFHAITGKRDRNKNLWYGLGRGLKDPNKWVNKFFSSIMWQLSVNPKGGLLAEEDAFEDQAEAEDSWADPSKITFARPGAVTNGKIQPKPAGTYPQGMDRLMEFSMNALPQVSGINAELLGLTQHDQPGVVEAQRKQGALAIIAWFFDGMRRYYKEAGECMLWMMREYIADGRLVKIVGKENAQYVPLLKDQMSAKFDIIVEEAPTSVNMKDRSWAVLQTLLPQLLQAGIKVPPEYIDYAPIPSDLSEKFKEAMRPNPQQMQEMQQGKQLAMAEQGAKVEKTQADAKQAESAAQLNQAKVQEIAAKIPGEAALMRAETMKKSAEAGATMAGN